ncbi:MAG: hypothetical protein WD423_16675 [Rhodothermales bacterium]
MDPLTAAQTELSKVGYETWQEPDETDRVYFEDRSVFGMVTTYASVRDLIDGYEDRQNRFLRTNENALRSASNQEKVWNAYTVHLAVGDFSEADREHAEQENKLFRIEENFRGTRKIARANVTDVEGVVAALLPLLPIQRKPKLAAEDYRKQLEEELREEFDEAFLSVLDENALPVDIVNDLLQDRPAQDQ